MGQIKTLPLNDANFLNRLRLIVADSSKVVLLRHAKERMRERKVSFRQVLDCLRLGRLAEKAHQSIQGDWKATLEHQCAGEIVRVAVAIEEQESGDLAVVITVMN